MNIQDLDLNMNLKLVSVVPLKLVGNCKDIVGVSYRNTFMILEIGESYHVMCTNGFVEEYLTLKEAIQECYIQWGE